MTVVACGSGGSDDSSGDFSESTASFGDIASEAQGQTVRWWMYGGDPRFNAFVDDVVTPAASKEGVRLVRVPIADTADAVKRVVAEERAGKSSGGGVDLIWINGENFASGKEVGLWRKDWAEGLPNRELTDAESPLLSQDFGVDVDGQESPWSRAGFVFAYDKKVASEPPSSFPELLEYAKENPGRFAYPAPPDFTGSAFVRQVVQRLGSTEAATAYLRELKPLTYAEGKIQPKSEQELSQLFANGKVDFSMSYNSNFIDNAVLQGQFPDSTRPFLIGDGALQNASFVTIPANASSPQGAQVVANLLLDPSIQARMQDPKIVGMLSVLDPDRLDEAQAAKLAPTESPFLLQSLGTPLNELPVAEVSKIDDAWIQQVQR
ncbi:MAG: ABC transporter substrate-binding protein [Solirubrobacterales bacterium]|nr:ABC transporter substrate-binding protein [Solirubrobacterales bacterium]